MRFNDGAADGQSHAGPMKLRGKERIEDLVRLLRGKPYAGIADGHHKSLVFRSLRFDDELARPIHIFHRIDAVTDEVHHDLLQLHAISHDLGKVRRQVPADRYGVSRHLAAQEDDHLSNNFVYIQQLPLRSTLLEEQADPTDDFRCTRSIFHDFHRSLARLFEIWGVASEPAQAGIGVGDSGG